MRILLVDDDAGAAQALVAVLNTLSGHEVRTAHSGEEALAAAAGMSGVDLLITDVVMEPMDGFTLRDQLVALYPSVRTILISGYDLSEYPEQTQNHQLLSKPVDTDTLRSAVNRELPAEAPTPEPVAAVEAAPVPAEAPAAPVAEEVSTPAPEAAPEPAPVPVATPAAPTPVAVPVPVARPAATPVAVPAAAKPVAVPVAKPTAVPVPVPVAKTAAQAPVPVARPTAVPTPRVAVAKAAPAAPAATPSVKATPVAQPVAKPQAVPVAATPAPTAVPVSATPKAVPAAPPVATAVPRPAAATPAPATPAAVTPTAATPVATPSAPATPTPATPVAGTPAQPTVRMAPTVKAQPVPTPRTPGATPVVAKAGAPATPVGKPAGTPVSPQAKPAAVPVATPRAGAAPVPTTNLTPTAVPKAAAPAASASQPIGTAPSGISAPSLNPTISTGSGEDLSGKALGAYQIHRKTGESRWGGVYAGTQTSINRAVSIEILDVTKAADETAQARFVADARAKAAVQHPSILAVYEAGEAEGRFFYAYEYVDGSTIAELKTAGKRLDEPTALKVLRVAADGLSYFNVHHTPHTPPDANSVSLGNDGHPRLANLATQLSDETLTPPQEIQALGRVMLGVLPAIQSLSPGLRELLKRMVQAGPQALTAWGQVLQAVKALEPKIIPTDAAKINAQDRAAIAAVEAARKQQKRSFIITVASMASLVILLAVTGWYFLLRNKQRVHNELIHVPAGEFTFANGQKKTLPEFWIDQYEVTFGEYAEFVKALEARPTTEYDHPKQPALKRSSMHKPTNWEIFYGRAREGLAAKSVPIDLSCPVMEVDFWDAYAYAKWKGRELPTEEEWEKAARGKDGFLYPWGNTPDEKKANSNVDYNGGDPRIPSTIDGFGHWNPVDKMPLDKSPFGAIGMAGNVREWTGTWDTKAGRVIAKGGSFKSTDSRVDQRVDLDPGAHDESLGFRTITRTPPSK